MYPAAMQGVPLLQVKVYKKSPDAELALLTCLICSSLGLGSSWRDSAKQVMSDAGFPQNKMPDSCRIIVGRGY